MAFQSTLVSPAPRPNWPARRISAATSALCTKILLGMQPRLRQVPPNAPSSMSATGPCPGSSGTRELPEPDPMMANVKCCIIES
jgi:hypothetical protein